MNIKKLALAPMACIVTYANCQEVIEVTDQTIKIGGFEEKTMYYAFNEGDQIIFDFEEIKGNELKEIEIAEYPSNSKFTDFKTAAVKNKTIKVARRGIYVFRFNNGNLKGRICKLHIQRVPASENTKNFNTEVIFKTFHDTTWIPKSKVIIERYDTIAETVLDKQGEVVHSYLNSEHGDHTDVEFILPRHTAYWSYWIGVGEETMQGFAVAEKMAIKNALKYFGMCNPLAALAAGGISYLSKTVAKNNVIYKFWYANGINRNAMVFHEGGDIKCADYGVIYPKQLGVPSEGYMYVHLYNDNTVTPINVNIKILAVKHVPVEKTIHYKEAKIESHERPVMAD